MFSRFFIDRPIFAVVLTIVIILGGVVCISALPLAQFPRVSPPIVSVSCTYPGASARDVAEAVAAPIEQQVNGVEGMMYMSSTSTNDGSYSLTVTFHHTISIDMAQVMVQNRVGLALNNLPDVIKQTGVTVRKRSPDPVMGFAIVSPKGRYNQLYLSNYASRFVRDELLRVPGVSDINMMAQRDYSVRIWINPYRLAARGLTANDLAQAIRDQNAELAMGSIGQPPLTGAQEYQVPLDTLGRLETIDEFEHIIVKTMPDGRVVRLKDVARVELGARNQDVACRFDRMDAAFMVIFQTPDANALETRDLCLAKMKELEARFPEDVRSEISFDTTPYTRECIREVFKTLRDAMILVALVVLLFLQNWRSAIIPLAAVPSAIIGTFAVMAMLDFSLNNLTLFGLVLAIGIVVDDAIVVVEAVEHNIEHGMSPREATIKAMEQVSGPVIAVGLVLSAVFIPCAFISGITGAFFRQFALTIAVSTLISTFSSLTLTPALTALLLRPRSRHEQPTPLPRLAIPGAAAWFVWHLEQQYLAPLFPEGVRDWLSPLIALLPTIIVGWLVSRLMNRTISLGFRGFNAAFTFATNWYTRGVGVVLNFSAIALIAYLGLVGLTYWSFHETPKGFIPQQDMGYLLVAVQLPDSASPERTDEALKKLEDIGLSTPGIRHMTAISGQSFALSANGPNFGSMFINLKDFDDRRDPALSAEAIANNFRARAVKEVPEAFIAIFMPPPVRGAGRAGGFAFVIEDREDIGPQALQTEVEKLVRLGNQTPGMSNLFTVFRANIPQIHIEPDKEQCLRRGVYLKDFSDTLRIYQGSLYVNDFNLFGRTWQVIVQSDSQFRLRPEQLNRLKTRNIRGQMVPLGSLADIKEVNGPLVLTRYNMYPAATINGSAAPGFSSRQAIDIMQQLASQELPRTLAYEWTDMSFLELLAGNTALLIFACAVVMVFLVLAALYESWSMPLAVILVVPMCILSAIAGVNIAKQEINIFTQIGFVVLVGLASKNAILIVEYARELRLQGVERRKATMEASRLRLRPIIMTSLAFILGVMPLLLSHGAGAEMRRSLGNAVFAGMIGVTLFGIFLTPVFFYLIDRLGEVHPFADGTLRRASDAVLDVLSLGPVRRTWGLIRELLPARNGAQKKSGHRDHRVHKEEAEKNGVAPVVDGQGKGRR